MLESVGNVHRMLTQHPLTRHRPVSAYRRWLRWQIASRAGGMPIIVPFVDDTHIAVGLDHPGVRGNIYVGLLEFEDMSFTLHLLREGDLFGDIGANMGVYTVLAAGARGAEVVAVEPVPATVSALRRNIAINGIGRLVDVRETGVGDESGVTFFSVDEDCLNHVVAPGEGLEVPLQTLDEIFANRTPILLKLDVEGFEAIALKGAAGILRDPALKAIIVELNGLGSRYGHDDRETDAMIRGYGFQSVGYDPWTRCLWRQEYSGTHNTLYVRDIASIVGRLTTADRFHVLDHAI